MTYEERIAAAQKKTELFKTKMSAVSEKAKAARALRKEEIDNAIDAINDDLDELDAAFAKDFAEAEAGVKGDIAAVKENIRLAKDRKDSKIYAFKLKMQMKADAIKSKTAERREENDKIAIENYILDLIDYAEACEQVAFAAAIEADLALLEAAVVAAEYVEKYGEAEIPEEKSAE